MSDDVYFCRISFRGVSIYIRILDADLIHTCFSAQDSGEGEKLLLAACCNDRIWYIFHFIFPVFQNLHWFFKKKVLFVLLWFAVSRFFLFFFYLRVHTYFYLPLLEIYRDFYSSIYHSLSLFTFITKRIDKIIVSFAFFFFSIYTSMFLHFYSCYREDTFFF